MTGPEGLDVTLVFLAADLADLSDELTALSEEADATGDRLDDLEERVRRVAERLDVERLPGRPERVQRPKPEPAPEPASWGQLVERATAGLAERGVDPETVAIDDLLDPEEVARIEHRHAGGFRVRSRLDPYDVAAAVVAGTLGAIVDALVVRVPANVLWGWDWQPGSSLTRALRGLAVDSDNWLATFARVPFDRVVGTGLTPLNHRVRTFGHDPLFGLVMGVTDIMRGTLTSVGPTGEIAVLASPALREENPALALSLEVLHLLSDVSTHTGLPLPGWAALLTVGKGSIGPGGQTVGEIAAWMNQHGYDSWHFLTMSTSVAAIETTTRGYFALRQHLDDEYRLDVEAEGARVLAKKVSDHPRYQSISLLAHAIAAAGNLGKLAFAGGNPLTLNYPQWLMLSKRLLGVLDRPAPSSTLPAQADHNRITLDTGWSKVDMVMSRLEEA